MSFRCASCNQVSRVGRLFVTETREKEYTELRFEGNRGMEVSVGRGFETVKEQRLCPACLSTKEQAVEDMLNAEVQPA